MKNFSKTLLILSGLDPAGGAGMIRDVLTAERLHCPYVAWPTAVTLQNDRTFLFKEMFSDNHFSAFKNKINPQQFGVVKLGMLADGQTVKAVSGLLRFLKKNNPAIKVIWDPVLQSTSGGELLDKSGVALALKKILPLCDLVTPNANEIRSLLTLRPDEKERPADWVRLFFERYRIPVCLKGGHLRRQIGDYFYDGKKILFLKNRKVFKNKRGTGCVFATAAAVGWLRGLTSPQACLFAQRTVRKYLTNSNQKSK